MPPQIAIVVVIDVYIVAVVTIVYVIIIVIIVYDIIIVKIIIHIIISVIIVIVILIKMYTPKTVIFTGGITIGEIRIINAVD